MILPIKKSQLLLTVFLCSFVLAFIALPSAYGQQTSTRSETLEEVESLQAEIQMSAGVLEIATQRQSSADMQFTYTREDWKPEIQITAAKGQGRLSVKQPKGKSINMRDQDQNKWAIQLPEYVPTDLKVRIGAGEGTVNLQNTKLQHFEMDAGAGEFYVNLSNSTVSDVEINAGVGSLTLDLTGKRTTNLQAGINGGIGDLQLLLPKETGVRVKINGLGGLDHRGFKKVDGYYVNEAYGKTAYSMNITVNGGLGSLELALEDAIK